MPALASTTLVLVVLVTLASLALTAQPQPAARARPAAASASADGCSVAASGAVSTLPPLPTYENGACSLTVRCVAAHSGGEDAASSSSAMLWLPSALPLDAA